MRAKHLAVNLRDAKSKDLQLSFLACARAAQERSLESKRSSWLSRNREGYLCEECDLLSEIRRAALPCRLPVKFQYVVSSPSHCFERAGLHSAFFNSARMRGASGLALETWDSTDPNPPGTTDPGAPRVKISFGWRFAEALYQGTSLLVRQVRQNTGGLYRLRKNSIGGGFVTRARL